MADERNFLESPTGLASRDGLLDHASERLSLEKELLRAVDREEFLLHYQPKVDLGTGQVTEVEALVRWQNPERGMLLPLQFIPLAEETGSIIAIGEWVLRTACAQNKAWQMRGLPPVRVTVNVSSLQFGQADFARTIQDELARAGLEPKYLGLELTESAGLHDNVELAIKAMEALRLIGVQLAVDNFGTGYASFAYLKRLPLDVVQIDRSFLHDVTTDHENADFVTAVIAIAHGLGLKVVAEGVEEEDQLAFVRGHGCDIMQGDLFSKPLPARGLLELLRQPHSLPA